MGDDDLHAGLGPVDDLLQVLGGDRAEEAEEQIDAAEGDGARGAGHAEPFQPPGAHGLGRAPRPEGDGMAGHGWSLVRAWKADSRSAASGSQETCRAPQAARAAGMP